MFHDFLSTRLSALLYLLNAFVVLLIFGYTSAEVKLLC